MCRVGHQTRMCACVQAEWKEHETYLQSELQKLRVAGEYVDILCHLILYMYIMSYRTLLLHQCLMPSWKHSGKW